MQELVNELGSNGAFSGTLAADSSNVVTLVGDLYNVSKISHKLCEICLRCRQIHSRVLINYHGFHILNQVKL